MELLLSQWRCLTPANAINRSGQHSAKLLFMNSFCAWQDPGVRDIVGPADVIVVQRNAITPEAWDAISYWRGLGKPTILDLDDDYPNLPWSNPAHSFWIRNGANLADAPIAFLTQGMRHCDALSSPSRVILDDWKEVVPGIHVPNYPDGEWYSGVKPREPDGKIVLGWGGSVSHYDSWWFSGVRPALERVCKAHPEVVIKLCGNDPRLFDQLDVRPEQKLAQPGVPPLQWPGIVGTFDIGLAPLDLREGARAYDNRRSWIKGIEYLVCGVPWIASRSEPYRDLTGWGVMVENTPQDWQNALEEMISHLEQARRAARVRRRLARRFLLERNIDRIMVEYQKVKAAGGTGQLPQVFYVHWDKTGEAKPETPAAPQPSSLPPRLDEPTLSRIQSATFAATKAWSHSAHLEHLGLNLAAPMRYDLMQHLNTRLIAKLTEERKAHA